MFPGAAYNWAHGAVGSGFLPRGHAADVPGMTPEPFVRQERPRPHPFSHHCACKACDSEFDRRVRSNGGNPHRYAQKPVMSFVPILVSLGWLLAAALVVLLGALAGGFISWNPLS